MKYFLIFLCVVLLGTGLYWFFISKNTADGPPSNLPTIEERNRMSDIEKTSSQIAPNAVPGAGVRPKGSTPPPIVVTESDASSTNESGIESE